MLTLLKTATVTVLSMLKVKAALFTSAAVTKIYNKNSRRSLYKNEAVLHFATFHANNVSRRYDFARKRGKWETRRDDARRWGILGSRIFGRSVSRILD